MSSPLPVGFFYLIRSPYNCPLRHSLRESKIKNSAIAHTDSEVLIGITFYSMTGNIFVMDEEKFNRLSLTDRAGLVWSKGVFVDSVLYNNYCVMLYSIRSQFVELTIDLHTHTIVWITLANEYDLKKYLENFNIEV